MLFLITLYKVHENSQETETLKQFIMDQAGNSIMFGDTFESAGVPFIKIEQVNGIELDNCVMLIDTGANVNFIEEDIVKSCIPNYSKELEYDSDIMTIQGTLEMNKSLITTITIDNKELKDRFVVVDHSSTLDYIASDTDKNVIGIIGSEFMNKYGFNIDMKKLMLKF